MPNYEIAVMPSSPVAAIACAVYCCDRKVYQLKPRKNLSPCTSLGKKKDHCVRQNVKKAMKENGIGKDKLQVEPKRKVTVGKETFTCKPDFMVDGSRIIDVKYSCDDAKLRAKFKGRARQGIQSHGVGAARMTPKERKLYPLIRRKDGGRVGKKGVKVMGPEEAEKKKGSDCKCS